MPEEFWSALWGIPPASEWAFAAACTGGIVLLLVMADSLRKRWGVRVEITRKVVHIGVGVFAAFTPWWFDFPLPVLVLSAVFLILNGVAIRSRILPGINGIDRSPLGTLYFPLAFFLLVALFWSREPWIITLSMLVLALGDAAAGLIGDSLPRPSWYHLTADRKSIEGSMAMFVVSFAVMFIGLHYVLDMDRLPLAYALACAGVGAATATAWEGLSSHGLDNLTIPLSVAFVLTFFIIPPEHAESGQLALGASLGIFIAAASYRFGLLTADGAVATFLLASVVFGIGGWKWTLPLVSFFLLSSLISRINGRTSRDRVSNREAIGRNSAQVFANGAVAGIIAIVSSWYGEQLLYPLAVGSVSAVTADTWGTEVGVMSKGRTVRMIPWGDVPKGANGGVTALGLVAGIAGSVVIVASAAPWLETTFYAWIVVAGLAGSLVDSLIGGALQAEYRCPVCGSLGGMRTHCNGQPTALIRGVRFVNNDTVNWICAASGMLVMAAVLLLGQGLK